MFGWAFLEHQIFIALSRLQPSLLAPAYLIIKGHHAGIKLFGGIRQHGHHTQLKE